jgi:hypothetical protein
VRREEDGSRCFQDELSRRRRRGSGQHETVEITKHGKPVAKLVPVIADTDEIHNFLGGKGSLTGDVVSPTISPKDWGELN